MKRHLYKDKKGRLVASIRVNGKQCLKRVKSEEQARQWFLLMETESTQASELTFKQLNDAARAFTLLKERDLDLSLSDLVLSYLKDRPTGRSPSPPRATWTRITTTPATFAARRSSPRSLTASASSSSASAISSAASAISS